MGSIDNKIKLAKRLLVNYFRVAIETRGLSMQSDEIAEIELIVDLVFDAAVEQALAYTAASFEAVNKYLDKKEQ